MPSSCLALLTHTTPPKSGLPVLLPPASHHGPPCRPAVHHCQQPGPGTAAFKEKRHHWKSGMRTRALPHWQPLPLDSPTLTSSN